jgi:hypothetical protein
LALAEDSIRYRCKIRDFTEKSVEKAWNINVERRVKLFLQRVIKVFPVLGGIDEAARIEKDKSLVRIG